MPFLRLRRSALVGLLLAAALLRAWPLEISEGRLKLVLHQGIGRFSLYLDGVALFVDQDPRTSGMSLLLDNRVYKLGDSGEFKESAETVPGGARFSWASKRLAVTQSFSFQGAETVAMSITIRNTSDQEHNAGLRFLLDTYLGETGFPHFRTERDREINTELSYLAPDLPAYWSSRSSRASRAPENPGLLMLLRGEGVTSPDRLVLANWKRLSEASWLYETVPARSFSELPYSINDSAACLYFGPAPLAAGASRTYLLVLSGGKDPAQVASAASAAAAAGEGSAAAPASTAPAAAAPPSAPSGSPTASAAPPAAASSSMPLPAPAAALKPNIESDLRLLDDLLQKLAAKMSSKAPFSEEEKRQMEQVIAEVKKRLESYGE